MNEPRDYYAIVCTPEPSVDAALLEALAAHQRRRPKDRRVLAFDPSYWTTYAVRSRVYRVAALRGWRRSLARVEALGLDLCHLRRRAGDARARKASRG